MPSSSLARRFAKPNVSGGSGLGVFLAFQIALVATGTYSSAWTMPLFIAFVVLFARWPGHMKKRVALLEQPA